MTQRQSALTTGISLLLMAVVAAFSMGYAFSGFYPPAEIGLVQDEVLRNLGLYKAMLIGIVIILLLDLIVSYTLYRFFEADHKALSALTGIIRVVYTAIFAVGASFLMQNLAIHDLGNEQVLNNFQQFQTWWFGGLVLFGFHVILLGVLMKLHPSIPKVLWYLTLFAGVCYVVLHVLKLTMPEAAFVINAEMILALPMALGELALAVWLIVKGGKAAAASRETHAAVG